MTSVTLVQPDTLSQYTAYTASVQGSPLLALNEHYSLYVVYRCIVETVHYLRIFCSFHRSNMFVKFHKSRALSECRVPPACCHCCVVRSLGAAALTPPPPLNERLSAASVQACSPPRSCPPAEHVLPLRRCAEV